jgi:hypothetical protein
MKVIAHDVRNGDEAELLVGEKSIRLDRGLLRDTEDNVIATYVDDEWQIELLCKECGNPRYKDNFTDIIISEERG